MNSRRVAVFLLTLAVLTACGTPAPVQTPQVLHVQYTLGTRPWLTDLYTCAEDLPAAAISVEQRPASLLDPGSADLILRLGVPPRLSSPAYDLGEDELLVIVHPDNTIPSLTTTQAAALFSGRIHTWKTIGGADLPVHIWAFNGAEDIQQTFNAIILKDGAIPATARQAQSVDEMSAGVASDPAAIGILPKRLLSGSVRPVPLQGAETLVVPVLAIVQGEPQENIRSILACLQK